MEPGGLQARIEHGIAELRAAYPRVGSCHFALHTWREGDRTLHSLWLDIRWPGHQTVLSGPPCANPGEAIEAALAKAARGLEESRA